MSEEIKTSPYRVVVLISGNGSNLQALIDQQHILGYQVVGVISNKEGAYGLTRAGNAGISVFTIKHKDFKSREDFDRALKNTIINLNANLVVLAGFMRILTPAFTRYFSGKLINIHPSILPNYKGLDTHKRVLENNEKYHGATVHFVTEALDDGAIIIQAKLLIEKGDTEDTLQKRIQVLEHKIFPTAVGWLANKQLYYHNNQVFFDNRPLPATGFQYSTENDQI